MELVRHGKVRDLYIHKDIKDSLLFFHSDRLSSFDLHICDVEGKGELLMLTSIWWMNQTKHIIRNHYLNHHGNYMLVKKAQLIPIEFIVRGYITGSTNTSLWTHYNNGVREYCGNTFPDGLVKNQKLTRPVLTPTTKSDEHDELITKDEIIRRGILTKEQYDYIETKAFELFEYGQKVASNNGLILVDTKYEFGFDLSGNTVNNTVNDIMLIDEIHTGDSSRYWMKDTYDELFKDGKNPDAIDKDSVRRYVKSVCPDPYGDSDKIPSPEDIPVEIKNDVFKNYNKLYTSLTKNDAIIRKNADCIDINTDENVYTLFNNLYNNFPDLVVILSGSTSDEDHIANIRYHLGKLKIQFKHYVCSAHKKTKQLLNILDMYNSQRYGRNKLVFVTVAGMCNALSGVVAANTNYPVIACPPFKDKDDMMININSSLQCPSKVPVMTILSTENVAISCKRMFDL